MKKKQTRDTATSQVVKQPVPARGASFTPIFSKPKPKGKFENKGNVDLKGLEASQRFLMTNFSSFDLKNWFDVTKHQAGFDNIELEQYFDDFTRQLCAEGKLNKVDGCFGKPIFEILG